MDIKKLLLTVCLLTLTSACETSSIGTGSTSLPTLTFENYQPVQINLGSVSIIRDQMAIKSYEDVVYFPIDVEKSIDRYLHKRFQSQAAYKSNSNRSTTITLGNLETSAKEVKKEKPSFVENFKQVFAGRTHYKIDGLVKMEMACGDERRHISQSLNFHKQVSVSNASSPYERDLTIINMMEELISNIDPELVRILDGFAHTCS